MHLMFERTRGILSSMKFSFLGSLTFASRLKVAVVAVVAVAVLLVPGCSDTGSPPDETAKVSPPEPPKDPNAKWKGATVKVKSIKDRS
jgi:uncharacterized lipoprotein YajG